MGEQYQRLFLVALTTDGMDYPSDWSKIAKEIERFLPAIVMPYAHETARPTVIWSTELSKWVKGFEKQMKKDKNSPNLFATAPLPKGAGKFEDFVKHVPAPSISRLATAEPPERKISRTRKRKTAKKS